MIETLAKSHSAAQTVKPPDSDGGVPPDLRVSPIVKALERHMEEQHLSLKELAGPGCLDLPYSTVSTLMRGARPFPTDHALRTRMARMMGTSGLQVAIWCELLTLEDFVVKQTFEDDARRALESMRADPSVSHFIPSDAQWNAMPPSGQAALVLMYQTLVGRRFVKAAQISPAAQTATSLSP